MDLANLEREMTALPNHDLFDMSEDSIPSFPHEVNARGIGFTFLGNSLLRECNFLEN